MKFAIAIMQIRGLILLVAYIQIQFVKYGQCQNILFPPIPQLPQLSLSDRLRSLEQALKMPTEDHEDELSCNSQVWNTFFNQGLRLAAASMRSRLPEGIPEYGIPPMEPLELDPMSLEISQDPIEMNVSLTNLNVWGLTNFTNTTTFLDVNTRILKMSIEIPTVSVTGMFTMLPSGQVGNMSITFDGVTFKGKTRFTAKIGDEGQTAIKADMVENEMKYEKVRIRTTDIFPDGNEKLNYAVQVFTERYSDLLYDEVKPLVNEEMDKEIIKITDAVLNSEVSHRALPTNGAIPGWDLSTLSGWYNRVRNVLQLPAVARISESYRSLISLLEAAFTSCRHTDVGVGDVLSRPFANLGRISN